MEATGTFREQMIALFVKTRGLTQAEAEVVYDRVGSRLDGHTHDEAVALHPSPPASVPSPPEPAEALEIRLRDMLDDDDAVSVVQIMLAAGWRPPERSGRAE